MAGFSNSAIPFPFDRSKESVGPRKKGKTRKEQKAKNFISCICTLNLRTSKNCEVFRKFGVHLQTSIYLSAFAL